MTMTDQGAAAAHPLLHFSHPDHHIPGYELPEGASAPLSRKACIFGCLAAFAVAGIGWGLKHFAGEPAVPAVPMVWMLPFVLLLACIAIMPFAAKHFWEKNYHRVSVGLGILVTAYYAIFLSAGKVMAATMADYISFIFLLGSLFVVSGGILIRTRRKATPVANTGMLLIGALLANVFGTTGASMLLIRPFLRMNKGHVSAYHVVFFIFAVANVGGALTPIGDPPLFLGYLRGVPFWWVAEHAWPIWCTAVGILLVVFFFVDSAHNAKQERAHHDDSGGLGPPVSIFGASNILFIAMILGAVFLESPMREGLMALAAFCSLATTPRRVHGENHFNYAPIKEVALLFIGIFATMVPAMNYLHNNATQPGFKKMLNTPGQFYFGSGALSSVLDNAPTYVTFLETALGKFTVNSPVLDREKEILATHRTELTPADFRELTADQVGRLKALHETLLSTQQSAIAGGTVGEGQIEMGLVLDDSGRLQDGGNPYFRFLLAVSMGSVFFGACTYIGNGPNFMVKSIADHAGAPTPSFFKYILFYTLPVLLPILILCWFLYLR